MNQVATTQQDWGAENWEPDGTDLLAPPLPIVTIHHPMSSKGSSRDAGMWYHADTKTFTESLSITLLRRALTRVAFGDAESPLCSSSDARVANPEARIWEMNAVKAKDGSTITIPLSAKGNVDHAGNHLCRGCFFASRREGDTVVRGICKANVQYFGIRTDDFGTESACILRISWTQAEKLDLWIKDNITSVRNRPLFSCRLHLGTEELMIGNNKQFRVVVNDFVPFPIEEARRHNEMLVAGREQFAEMLSRSGAPTAIEAPKSSFDGHDEQWGEEPAHVQQGRDWGGDVQSAVQDASGQAARLNAAQEALRILDAAAPQQPALAPAAKPDEDWMFNEPTPGGPSPFLVAKPFTRFDPMEAEALVGAPGFQDWAKGFLQEWGAQPEGRKNATLATLVGATETATNMATFYTQVAYWALAHDWMNPGANKQTLQSMLLHDILQTR